MRFNRWWRLCFTLFGILGMGTGSPQIIAADLPNILWITSEDHGPEMGCYGDKLARTPNVDALAAKGMLFKRAWSVAPVCAPARTAIISGVYPSSNGGLHMRSMVSMPSGAKMYPQYLHAAGYYCTNCSKTDYNLRERGEVWDESSNKAHWKNRATNQPFFAIFNSTKSHESQLRTRPHTQITDPAKVRVPAYHPDTPEVRQDWAQYYDKVSEADADAGKQLKEIAAAGLAEDTIVFYYGDHGSGMPRSKRWPCNSGLHVPMVVYFPPKWQHLAPKEYSVGGQSDRMVSFVDLAPTVLSIAGIKPPESMQGHAFAGPHQSVPPTFIYGERGRMDERMDLVRSVTDGRFVYLRNYLPHVSQAQRVAYQFDTPTTRVWNLVFTSGKATDAQSIFWRVPKDAEELYDLQSDRDEVKNLAKSPEHRSVLEKLRNASRQHILDVRDVCFLPELELHTRSEGTTPYDMARDSSKYLLERILAAAELASNLASTDAQPLVALMSDSDSAVRYWGAMGVLIRGKEVVTKNESTLEKALADESPCVRIVAAEALGLHGSDSSIGKALAALSNLMNPESNGVLASMSALAAIEGLGAKASSLHSSIGSMSSNGASPDGRYNSYVPRLMQNIVPDPTPAEGKAKKKNKNKNKE
ncbi:MAG: sulfatase-like hydrolase/transferase [Pirellulaceae bacterium]|nr:sulfatase-like hydrolase/transferase [Pirellulaceae bacterium]